MWYIGCMVLLQGERDTKQDAFNKVIKTSPGPAEHVMCECVWESAVFNLFAHKKMSTCMDTVTHTESHIFWLWNKISRPQWVTLKQSILNSCVTNQHGHVFNYYGVKGWEPASPFLPPGFLLFMFLPMVITINTFMEDAIKCLLNWLLN